MTKIILWFCWIFISIGCGSTIVSAQEFQWTNVPFRGMGFVTGIMIHPTDPDFIVIRTDVGGCYRWESNSSKWLPLLDTWGAPGVAANAMQADNAKILYAVTSGSKLLKSEDQGNTWNELSGFPDIYVNPNSQFYRWAGSRLAIEPFSQGKVLFYASERNGLWKSNDSGNSWQQISVEQIPIGTKGGAVFVACRPLKTVDSVGRSSQVYVGVQGEGIYVSEDLGDTWKKMTGGPDSNIYLPVCGIVSSEGICYITYSTMQNEWDDGSEGRIYRSNGLTLENITPTVNNKLGFTGIDVADNNPKQIIAMQWKPGHDAGIHHSLDGGASWQTISFKNLQQPSWYPSYVPWTYTGQIVFDKKNINKLWQTNGFGVYVTENFNVLNPTWTAQMDNAELLVAGQVFVPPVHQGKQLFTLVMDQIAFVHDSVNRVPASTVFKNDFGIGSGMDFCVANPSVSVVVGSNQNNVYSARHAVTIDNGASWKEIPSIPNDFNNGNIAISAQDENKWVWAPHNYYWGNEQSPLPTLYYTNNKGINWYESKGIPRRRNDATEIYAQSRYLVSDRVNGQYFYYYLQNPQGALYRSDDGGKNFVQVFTGLPTFYRCHLKSVPNQEGHLFFYTQEGELYHSSDYGSSWDIIHGVKKVRALGFGINNSNVSYPALYIAAEIGDSIGIFVSNDYGKKWKNIDNKKQVPWLKVRDIAADLLVYGQVYIATGGRGVLMGRDTSVSVSVPTDNSFALPKKSRIFPSPLLWGETISVELPAGETSAELTILNYLGQPLINRKLQENISTLHVGELVNGLYWVVTKFNTSLFSKSMLLIRR